MVPLCLARLRCDAGSNPITETVLINTNLSPLGTIELHTASIILLISCDAKRSGARFGAVIAFGSIRPPSLTSPRSELLNSRLFGERVNTTGRVVATGLLNVVKKNSFLT